MLLAGNRKCRLLVLCTGNSARSIMAEALFNTLGGQYFEAFSAGSDPAGKVNPYALRQINGLSLAYKPRSKSWDEFTGTDSPSLDVIVTVCDHAAQAVCPVVSPKIRQVRWHLPDPAAAEGDSAAVQDAFLRCYRIFEQRINRLLFEMESLKNNDCDVVKIMNKLAFEDAVDC